MKFREALIQMQFECKTSNSTAENVRYHRDRRELQGSHEQKSTILINNDLVELLTVGVVAMLGGADTFTESALQTRSRLDWLRKVS